MADPHCLAEPAMATTTRATFTHAPNIDEAIGHFDPFAPLFIDNDYRTITQYLAGRRTVPPNW